MNIAIVTSETGKCDVKDTCNGVNRKIRRWYETKNGRLEVTTRCEYCMTATKRSERMETLQTSH